MSDRVRSEVVTAARRAIVDELEAADHELRPAFYAVTGSHLHGVPGPDSDLDVRGFHCAHGARYMLFDEPAARVSVTTSLPSSGTEIDAVSLELRTFGRQLLGYDFPTVEAVYAPRAVLCTVPGAMDELRERIEAALPGELAQRYRGMARSVYGQHLRTGAPDRADATPKLYLHAVRGVLAADHVRRHASVEPDLTRLAGALPPDERAVVRALIAAKRAGSTTVAPEVGTRARKLVRGRLDAAPSTTHPDERRGDYQRALADWMLSVRDRTDTLRGSR